MRKEVATTLMMLGIDPHSVGRLQKKPEPPPLTLHQLAAMDKAAKKRQAKMERRGRRAVYHGQ